MDDLNWIYSNVHVLRYGELVIISELPWHVVEHTSYFLKVNKLKQNQQEAEPLRQYLKE
jgi:hypothetical protein